MSLVLVGCDGPTDPLVGPPADLAIVSGDAQTDSVGALLAQPLVVRVADAEGRPVPDVVVEFRPAPGSGWVAPASATTDTAGVARAEWRLGTSAGEQSVEAAALELPPVTFRATARPGRVASVTVEPDTAMLLVGDTLRLGAALADAHGNPAADRAIEWSSSDTAVASVDGVGLVRASAEGHATITATSEGGQDTAVVVVAPPARTFAAVYAGSQHSCALTAEGEAYCWGANSAGQIGVPRSESESCPYLSGTFMRCSTVPVPVSGEHRWKVVRPSVFVASTCGVTTEGVGYCWGSGPFGNGVSPPHHLQRPTDPVSGGITFQDIGVGTDHACGLAVDGTAHCWGDDRWGNEYGQLGSGDFASSELPVAVTGGFTFRSLAVTWAANCGLTDTGQAYCWGAGGSLGNGSAPSDSAASPRPVEVAGGQSFDSIWGGAGPCAITADDEGYCWGANGYQDHSRIGNGDTAWVTVPTRISGGLAFHQLARGTSHTCGVTTDGKVYCWGGSYYGEIGDGRSGLGAGSSVPVAVASDLTFTAVAVGDEHSCALTADGQVWCWGRNDFGQLGNGTTEHSSTPVRIDTPPTEPATAPGLYR